MRFISGFVGFLVLMLFGIFPQEVFENFDIISLLKLDIPIFEPENLPKELANIPAIKPGSRKF